MTIRSNIDARALSAELESFEENAGVQGKRIRKMIGAFADELIKEVGSHGMQANTCDGIREVEAVMYGYIRDSNPAVWRRLAAPTKWVRIKLSALTRSEYSEVLEVPIDITDDQLHVLMSQRYRDVDGGHYNDDPNYWERGDCSHEAADKQHDSSPTGRVLIKDGEISVQEI